MKPTLTLILSLALCLPLALKAQEANTPEKDLSPSSPEDTSSADALLPSTQTEAQKVDREKVQAMDDSSTADTAMPGEPKFKDQLTKDIQSSTQQAQGGEAVSTGNSGAAGQTPPSAPSDSSDANTAASSPKPAETSGDDIVPVKTFAPDTSGMTVKEVKVEEPVYEATETADGTPEMAAVNQEVPALEMDFADSGEVTMEFPTDEQGEVDMSMGAEDTISVDFPDEEVRTIIRNVADLYDLNVVIPDTLVGNTSVKLRNVTWRQVFEVVLQPLGFTYVEDRNIIKIRNRDELLQEPTDTRVFLINYAVAKNLQASLAPLVDAAAGGRIQVDDRTNSLLITERPSRMNDIQEIIERLDRPNAQVMIESKFIEVNDRDQENLGVNWTSLNAYPISAGPFQRDYIRERSTEDLNSTTGSQFRNISNTNANVNGVPTNTTTNALGTTFNNAVDVATTAATGRIDTAVFSAPAFTVVLSALETLSDSKLLTNPTLVTLDGEEAKILIGDKYPIPNYAYNEERGTFEVSGFGYEDIGIVMTVRPQVNAAGFIRLDVNPQLSRQNGEVNFGGAGGATIPIINTTETESSVILKDGYTLAIGGLIDTRYIDGEDKVPFLGDIPGLGYLFKSTSKNKDERNLIIFITARTLNPDGTTYKDIIDPRVLYRMGITEADIPGMTIPEEQADAMRQIFDYRSKIDHDMRQAEMFEKISTLEQAKQEQAAAVQAAANQPDTSDAADEDSSQNKRRAVSRAR